MPSSSSGCPVGDGLLSPAWHLSVGHHYVDPMSDSSPSVLTSTLRDSLSGSGTMDRLDRGLDVLFAAEVTRDVAAAIDVEQLESGASLDQAVEYEKLGSAIGRPVGRLLANGAVRGALKGGVAGLVIREAASRAGAAVLRTALHRADTEAMLERLDPGLREEFLEARRRERARGPDGDGATGPEE